MFELALLLFLCFFIVGLATMPTAHSNVFAKKHNIEDRNSRRQQAIRRAVETFKDEYPQFAQLYRLSIITFASGFGLVALWDITTPGHGLSPVSALLVGIGLVMQVLSLCTFSIVAVLQRQYIVSELRAKGLDKKSA